MTGGAGFIGSAVVRQAIADGHEVVNLDALTYAANLANLDGVAASNRYAFEQADIRDRAALDRDLRRAPARRGDAPRRREPRRPLDRRARRPSSTPTSSAPTRCSRRRARTGTAEGGDFRFHHISTDEVFGSLGDDGPVHRDDALRPELALLGVEGRVATTWSAPGARPTACRCVLTNCSNNYGPYHFPEKLIPVVILNALAGRDIPVYGTGENVRDWLYVEDHADARCWPSSQRGQARRELQHRRQRRGAEHRHRAPHLRACWTR